MATPSVPAFRPAESYPQGLLVGLDVGSTTVKFVVCDPASDRILMKDYRRHDTRQPETCLAMLTEIERVFPDAAGDAIRVFATGSGGAAIARHINAAFVQEVNAVSLAVEKFHPDVQSVIELGGQDAKIIIFKPDLATGRARKIPSMNDKCAGGTGAVIDKINAKLRLAPEQLADMGHDGIRIHAVAGKCGVFAETDINGLQKQGVPADELMASLFESIVLQNLSVLTRGHTLQPSVLLLGGPNAFIRGLREAWRHHLALLWHERGVALPEGRAVGDLVVVPELAPYFAAIGAVEFARAEIDEQPDRGVYAGSATLAWYIDVGRGEEKRSQGGGGLTNGQQELTAFKERFRLPRWTPPTIALGATIEVCIGLDGGSTSTKAVALDAHGELVAKAYQLSKGNPIEDTMDVFRDLQQQVAQQGARLVVRGVGTTGYAKDILKDVLQADVALVETVAHTQSALHLYPNTDVIVDVGGQDIKLIVVKDGRVKDFKLNTQCSAGNGYFLQSTAAAFGYSVERYADAAFEAQAMPRFGYGCAVFMQSDIVDFQRQGWSAPEIMAGLAAVLPKNIWLYVAQVANLPTLGSRFVLQGGTQYNLAAVKAQVDFIESRFAGTGVTPSVLVHRHCGESGAIGAALEADRLIRVERRESTFIGLDRVRQIQFRTTRNEQTRCYFCKNHCLRTFIDVRSGADDRPRPVVTPASRKPSLVPRDDNEHRLIVATCEKGTVEDLDEMREIKSGLDAATRAFPNLMRAAAQDAFARSTVASAADPPPRSAFWGLPAVRHRSPERQAAMDRRPHLRIGMPRVLNMYSHAPFFSAFFQTLGVPDRSLVFSDYTSDDLYRRGAKRGSIDPCFPSKLGIPHVHDLLFVQHARTPLTHIFFPMVDSFPTFLDHVQGSRACPTVVATPEAVHAAFTKEHDLFAERGIVFKKTFLNLDRPSLCARQMHEDWQGELGLSLDEAERATDAGLQALAAFDAKQRQRARALLDQLEAEDRIGIVVLARPYHNDPGVNHEICDDLQKRGYPIFFQDTLPTDPDLLDRLFGDEVASGACKSALSLDDVWKNSYSENTNRKLWAAKFVARHPNLVALELSSFKCGHDAPIYSTVEEIVERSGTPYFCFKDIDENKPAGAIRIRIETIAYFLDRYRERLVAEQAARRRIEAELKRFEASVRTALSSTPRYSRSCGNERRVSERRHAP